MGFLTCKSDRPVTKKRKQKTEKRGIAQRLTAISDRYAPLILSAVLLLALILRAAALLNLENSIYTGFLLWDERVYHSLALKIMDGTRGLFTVFGSFMALIYKLFAPDILYIRILNIILGVLTCYLVYLIGKEMINRTTGLWACLIAGLYKPFIFYSIVPLKTALSVFLFAATIYFFIAILNQNSIIKALLLGIAIGLLGEVRPNFLVIVPVLPLFVLFKYWREKSSMKMGLLTVSAYIVGISIALVPFTISRHQALASFGATTSQIGLNLYLGNNLQNPDPYYRPAPFARTAPLLQAREFNIEASRRAGKKLSSREAGFYWTREVLRMAVEQPAAFSWKILQKTLVFFNRFEAGDHYHIGFVSDFVKFFKFPFLGLWLILPFGMAGMAVNAFRSIKLTALCSVFFLYGLSLIIFFTNTRYRLPLLVILIPFCVIGIGHLISCIRERQFNKVFIYFSAVTISFFIIEFLPVRGTDDMTAYYNTHAIILNSKGFEDEAIQYWETSSRMNKPFSAFANRQLALKYLKQRNLKKSIYYLTKIPDDSFAAAKKYAMIGDIMATLGQAKKAVAAYERSLEINSGERKTRRKLLNILWKIDKKKAKEQHAKLKYISSFYGRGG